MVAERCAHSSTIWLASAAIRVEIDEPATILDAHLALPEACESAFPDYSCLSIISRGLEICIIGARVNDVHKVRATTEVDAAEVQRCRIEY